MGMLSHVSQTNNESLCIYFPQLRHHQDNTDSYMKYLYGKRLDKYHKNETLKRLYVFLLTRRSSGVT